MRNVEIKVRVRDLAAIRVHLDGLGAAYHWTRRQIDTYFQVPGGRLKLRETQGLREATLISYERPDNVASRVSRYHLLPVHEPETLRTMLSATIGVLAQVHKTRTLFTYGNTRIHLDEVERLGAFVELETVLGEQPPDEARREHDEVKESLGLDGYEPVPVSYSDLVLTLND